MIQILFLGSTVSQSKRSVLYQKKYQEEEEELTTKYHESHLFPPWRDATARIHYLVYARLPTVQTILKVMLHF
jgi:hypothetical protein